LNLESTVFSLVSKWRYRRLCYCHVILRTREWKRLKKVVEMSERVVRPQGRFLE